MKKINLYFWLSLSFILLYLLILYMGRFFEQGESLENWIIGNWSGERMYEDDTGVHLEEIRMEFIRPNILIYGSSLSNELEFGVVFRYNFISENQFDLSGRLRDSWTLTRTDDNLLISAGIWRNQVVTLRRDFGFGRLIVIILGILDIGILIYNPSVGNNITAISTSGNRKNIFTLFVYFSLHLLILLLGYKTGEFFVREFSSTEVLVHQGLPWHSIILAEVFLGVMIIGVKAAIKNYQYIKTSIYTGKAKYYLGIFLLGGSIFGTYIGLLRIFILYLLPLFAN